MADGYHAPVSLVHRYDDIVMLLVRLQGDGLLCQLGYVI